MSSSPIKIIREIFEGAHVDDALISRFFIVIKTLDEREQCILEKRMAGITLEKIGREIINLGIKRNPCDGLSKERVRQIYRQAIRKLRNPSRKDVWSLKITPEEWFRRKKR